MLWNELKTEQPERIEQVWFSGVHSNVGGGYPRQGMSLVALDWVMSKAEEHGLRFVPAERLMYRYHADVDDKMYDTRAGIGVFYRWQPRDVQLLCDANGVTPKVHRSVFERIARNTEGYAPGSLPVDAAVISTPGPTAAARGDPRAGARASRVSHSAAQARSAGAVARSILVLGIRLRCAGDSRSDGAEVRRQGRGGDGTVAGRGAESRQSAGELGVAGVSCC